MRADTARMLSDYWLGVACAYASVSIGMPEDKATVATAALVAFMVSALFSIRSRRSTCV